MLQLCSALSLPLSFSLTHTFFPHQFGSSGKAGRQRLLFRPAWHRWHAAKLPAEDWVSWRRILQTLALPGALCTAGSGDWQGVPCRRRVSRPPGLAPSHCAGDRTRQVLLTRWGCTAIQLRSHPGQAGENLPRGPFGRERMLSPSNPSSIFGRCLLIGPAGERSHAPGRSQAAAACCLHSSKGQPRLVKPRAGLGHVYERSRDHKQRLESKIRPVTFLIWRPPSPAVSGDIKFDCPSCLYFKKQPSPNSAVW